MFTKHKVAVYVDGCFWHSCPAHATIPAANRAWWEEKLAANMDRDERHTQELESAEWTVIRVWEHEDSLSAADRIEETLSPDNPSFG